MDDTLHQLVAELVVGFFFNSPGLNTKMMFPNLPLNLTIICISVLAYLFIYTHICILYLCKPHLPKTIQNYHL